MFQFIPISSFFKFFLPQFIRISSNSFVYLLAFPGPTPKVVVVRGGGELLLPWPFFPPIHSYIFQFTRISSFLTFFLPQFIRISSDSFVYLPSSIFFLSQFIRICSNSFLYLPSANFFSPNSFVYLPIHSYIFWPFQGRPPK